MAEKDIYQIPVRCRGVVAVLLKRIQGNYKILLMKRALFIEDTWCYVAGKIEKNETAWQAALREIREETGLTPQDFYSASICEQFYEVHIDSIWIAPVFVGIISDTDEVVLNNEHSSYKWFDMSEAKEAVSFPGQADILAHIEREFIFKEPNKHLRIQL